MAADRAKFPWRALLYGVVLLYLAGDLHVFHGPLRGVIDRRNARGEYARREAVENGWIATVNSEPITREQLNRAVQLHLYQRGADYAGLSDWNRRVTRGAVLKQLIRDTLVRQYARADNVRPTSAAAEAHWRRFAAQFPSEETMLERARAMGYSDAETLRAEVTDQLTQRLWLEERVKAATAVTEAEAREWYEANRGKGAGFVDPERVRARHIFLSTVVEDTPEREAAIREIHRRLTAEEADFTALAAEFSEDERTKHRGGDLGWFGRERMPRDFCDVAFGLRPGETSEPFRGAIGWHVVRVSDRRAERPLDFEEMKPEILALLESERRAYAIEILLRRHESVSVIVVFHEVLAGMP